MIKSDLLSALSDMETMAEVFGIEPFDVYLLGGSGCIIAGYLDRATRDFDIIDLEYSSRLGRVLKLLEPYDMIDTQMATITKSYKERAVCLSEFKYLRIFVLSREDIVVSKLGRYSQQDAQDIKTLLPACEIGLILKLIDEVLDRDDIVDRAKGVFIDNTLRMMEEYGVDVPDYVQQLEKLRGLIQ
jgi:hypothetical protein